MNDNITVKIKFFSSDFMPVYKTDGAACCDLKARGGFCIGPHDAAVIPTGVCLEIPAGYEGQVRPRSGLAAKKKIVAVNGTIDSDYRGEINVNLVNLSDEAFYIQNGDRIAQFEIQPVRRISFVPSDILSGTERGTGGFGSTGVRD